MENGHEDQDKSGAHARQDSGADSGKRKTFKPFHRMLIIATWGVLLACLTFYGLTKIGY